jgi:uncharacterized protein YndB with AHSA1/START domain
MNTEARLVTGGAHPQIRLERQLPDPPEVVWRVLTERDQLRRWFPCDVEVDGGVWVVGAALTYRFPPEVMNLTLTGEVLEVDEPYALAFTWGEETLRFSLTASAGGTALVLVDELPAPWAARNAAGWEDCLDRLGGSGADRGSWRERFAAYAEAFEPRIGPQEGPPAEFHGEG